MDRSMEIREGMAVYTEDGRQVGTVERMQGGDFHVAGEHYGRDRVLRVDHNRVYLRGAGTTTGRETLADRAEGEIRVPVAEERLSVGTREAELGEVQVRKTVTEERQTVPVTLEREEVHVEQRDIPDRPLQPGDDAFNEGTIRVPVRGEEAVVAKEAVVTGEVVIDKTRTSEQQQVSGTVRKQRVDVEENYRQARSGFEQEFQGRAKGTNRTFEQAEPNYRAGFTAAHDERYSGRQFEDAESELRREHETGSAGTTGSGESWEHLREEIRSGWNRARNS
jgi:uncharacterized protein (TIGR02271 family)